MRRYKVNILDTAKHDIQNIYNYISVTMKNKPAAFEHMADIYREINKLEYAPKAHKIYEGSSAVEMEYRIARVRQYLVLYTIDDDSGTVYIIRIYHSHREPEGMIGGEQAKAAFWKIREIVKKNRLQNMTLDEIDEEIRLAREERKDNRARPYYCSE